MTLIKKIIVLLFIVYIQNAHGMNGVTNMMPEYHAGKSTNASSSNNSIPQGRGKSLSKLAVAKPMENSSSAAMPHAPLAMGEADGGRGRKMKECPYEGCPIKVNSRLALMSHIASKKHLDLKPFACQLMDCDKRFSFPKSRDNHQTFHLRKWGNTNKKKGKKTHLHNKNDEDDAQYKKISALIDAFDNDGNKISSNDSEGAAMEADAGQSNHNASQSNGDSNGSAHNGNVVSDTISCPIEGCDSQFPNGAKGKIHLIMHLAAKKHLDKKPFLCRYNSCPESFRKMCDESAHAGSCTFHKKGLKKIRYSPAMSEIEDVINTYIKDGKKISCKSDNGSQQGEPAQAPVPMRDDQLGQESDDPDQAPEIPNFLTLPKGEDPEVSALLMGLLDSEQFDAFENQNDAHENSGAGQQQSKKRPHEEDEEQSSNSSKRQKVG